MRGHLQAVYVLLGETVAGQETQTRRQSSEGPAAGPYRHRNTFEFSKALDEGHRLRNHCEQLSLIQGQCFFHSYRQVRSLDYRGNLRGTKKDTEMQGLSAVCRADWALGEGNRKSFLLSYPVLPYLCLFVYTGYHFDCPSTHSVDQAWAGIH